jgi:hypothetical protein
VIRAQRAAKGGGRRFGTASFAMPPPCHEREGQRGLGEGGGLSTQSLAATGTIFAACENKRHSPPVRTWHPLRQDEAALSPYPHDGFGDWILGASGGYVTGQDDLITTRADLNSWRGGAEAQRGPLRIGAISTGSTAGSTSGK